MKLEGKTDQLSLNAMARNVAMGDIRDLAELFAGAGSPCPVITWAPELRDFRQRRMRRFAESCDRLGIPGGLLQDCNGQAEYFGPLSEWMMILRYDSEGRLVYDHYGEGIARVYGKNMTGATIAEFPGHIAPFFSTVYEAARLRRTRVLSCHQPPRQVFVSTWQRLVVPMFGVDNAITGFVVLNLPEHGLRAGLEAVPLAIAIVDRHDTICFANRVARENFDHGEFGPWNRSMFDYAGLDLQIDLPPGEILVRGLILHKRCRRVSHNQIYPYNAIINATLHHDTAFYVVTLQPLPHEP